MCHSFTSMAQWNVAPYLYLFFMIICFYTVKANTVFDVISECISGKTNVTIHCPQDHIISAPSITYRASLNPGCNTQDADFCEIGEDTTSGGTCSIQSSLFGMNDCEVKVKVPSIPASCSSYQGEIYMVILHTCEADASILDGDRASKANMCSSTTPWTGHVAYLKSADVFRAETTDSQCKCTFTTAPENHMEINVFYLQTAGKGKTSSFYNSCPYDLVFTGSGDQEKKCPYIYQDYSSHFYVDTNEGKLKVQFNNLDKKSVFFYFRVRVHHDEDMTMVCGDQPTTTGATYRPELTTEGAEAVSPGTSLGDEEPLTEKMWFWPAVGATGAVLLIVALGMSTLCCTWSRRSRVPPDRDLERYVYDNNMYSHADECVNNGHVPTSQRPKSKISLSTIAEESVAGDSDIGGYEEPEGTTHHYEELPDIKE